MKIKKGRNRERVSRCVPGDLIIYALRKNYDRQSRKQKRNKEYSEREGCVCIRSNDDIKVNYREV